MKKSAPPQSDEIASRLLQVVAQLDPKSRDDETTLSRLLLGALEAKDSELAKHLIASGASLWGQLASAYIRKTGASSSIHVPAYVITQWLHGRQESRFSDTIFALEKRPVPERSARVLVEHYPRIAKIPHVVRAILRDAQGSVSAESIASYLALKGHPDMFFDEEILPTASLMLERVAGLTGASLETLSEAAEIFARPRPKSAMRTAWLNEWRMRAASSCTPAPSRARAPAPAGL